MNFERIRFDRAVHDFHEAPAEPQKIDIETVLVELLPKGFFPKVYMCPSSNNGNANAKHIQNNFNTNQAADFVLLGEVIEFKRSDKTLFLKDGTFIFYQHLVIVSESSVPQSLQKQEEEFYRALHSLLDAIRVNAKMEVKEKMNGTNTEPVSKLRAMTKMDSNSESQDNESLATIKKSGKQSNIREPQNRLFELQL